MIRQCIILLAVLRCVAAFAPSSRRHPVIQRLSSRPSSAVVVAGANTASTELPEGLVKTVTKEGKGELVRLGDIATIQYSCYVPENPVPFARSARQKMVVGDGSMIVGWDKVVRSMRVGERSRVRLPPSYGYGENGVAPIIPSNSILELDLEILDSQPATANIDFDSLAEADNTPRTASTIAAAFASRQAAAAAASGPALEGLDFWMAKAKNFYFYGLFEGETGERPPWFLRPSITFPLAFLVVGAAFYISVTSGAIRERGAQVTDELDEIILSSNAFVYGALVTAFTTVSPVDLPLL